MGDYIGLVPGMLGVQIMAHVQCWDLGAWARLQRSGFTRQDYLLILGTKTFWKEVLC